LNGSCWAPGVAPPGTPISIINKLAAETAGILNDPALGQKAESVGIYPLSSTLAEFAGFIANQTKRRPAIVNRSGMHFD
jgi:tripartite-type tricarboxylate transporter receptor subunit TctC